MGVPEGIDKLKDKAVDTAGGADKLKEGIDKAADKVDEATGGKLSGHIDKGQDKLKEEVDEWNDPNAS